MTNLYGEALTRRDIAQRTGSLSQIAGVRLMECSDGVERGIRLLEFRTGTGLRFTVVADRAFDIADCEYRGAAIGWHSPTGFVHPALHEYEGEGGLAWLRSFSGLLVTCGLDHILSADSESAERYHYPNRKTIKHSLHGRISTIPGKLLAYGEQWRGDECLLFCEGLVQQSAVFAEDLHLHRRIESRVGSNEILIQDRVVNHGFNRTPHMLLYHINLGYPVLSERSRYLAPINGVIWAAHEADYRRQNAGYRTLSGPRHAFTEQVWEHSVTADNDGIVPVAVVNEAFDDGKGLGLLVETNKAEFPCHLEWQNFQEGHYTIGIEPSTNHVLGRSFAAERNELIWLEHGEAREYTTRLSVVEGKSILALEKRILSIVQQPTDEYPLLSGRWEQLR